MRRTFSCALRLNEERREVERFANDLIHIQVAIGAESPHEGHLGFLLRGADVTAQQGHVRRQPFRIKGQVVRRSFLRKLTKGDRRLVLLPRREMLVLVDAGMRDIQPRIIHERVALVIADGIDAFEGDRAIAKPAELEIELGVERSTVKQVIVFRACAARKVRS